MTSDQLRKTLFAAAAIEALRKEELARMYAEKFRPDVPQPARWHLIDTPDNETNARAQGGRG